MALGPKPLGRTLVDDLASGGGNPAPLGRRLVDDLVGGSSLPDDGQTGYNFNTGKSRGQLGADVIREDAARAASDAQQRGHNDRLDQRRAAREEAEADTWAETGRKFVSRIAPLLKQSIGGVAQSLVENSTGMPDNYAMTPEERQALEADQAAALADLRKRGKVPGQQLAASARADLAANEYNPGDSNTKKYAAMIAESMVQMLPSIGTAIATRNPELGVAAMLPQVYGQQYDESRDAGRGRGAAMGDAIFMSAAESLGEKIPLGMMMKPGGKFLTNTLKTAGAEGLQEMFTQVLQTGYDKGVLTPDMTWGEAFQQVVDAGIVGAGMGVGMHTLGGIARRRQPTTPGVIEQAEAAPAPVSVEDAASPLPTDLIEHGRKVAAASTATNDANSILASNGAPAVGTRVRINGRTGTVRDAFIDDTDADLGAQAGLHVDLDGGGTMREFFADLKDAGINIEGIDPDAIDKAVADMEAGGLTMPEMLQPDGASLVAALGDAPSGDIATTPTAQPRAAGQFDMARYMGKARQAESGGNDTAANTRSSASGRYQFTDGTFARYYRQVYGTDAPAGAKNDPAVQDRLMQAMTAENVEGLRRNGIPVDDQSVYAAHHFGLGGARSMYANPGAAVDAAIVKANPQFKGMTNAEALAWVGRHINGQKGGATAAPIADRPAPIEEADRQRLLDEPLSTAQVEVPAAADTTLAPATDTTEAVASPAMAETQPQAAAPEPTPASTATITPTASGKGITISGASDAELAAIRDAIPKASGTPSKSGIVYAAKYRPEIEQALQQALPAESARQSVMTDPDLTRDSAQGKSGGEQASSALGVPAQRPLSGGLDASALQSMGDRSVRQIERFRDLPEAQALLREPGGTTDIPTDSTVFRGVRSLVQNEEIGRAVVQAVPVDVMDFLTGQQGASELLRSNGAVLVNALASDDALPVRGRAIRSIVQSLALPVAVDATENAGRRPADSSAAGVAGQDNGQISSPNLEGGSSRTRKGMSTRTRTGPVDAVTFLADNGGIRDDEGHALKRRAQRQGAGSRDLSQFAPGGGHLFRRGGMTIDEAGELLAEAGYFNERPTTTQVLDLLDRAAFENQYRPADQAEVEQARRERRDENDRDAARVQALEALDELGITDDATADDLRGIIAYMSDGRSAMSAVEDFYRDQIDSRSEDFHEQTQDPAYDLPFDEGPRRSADFGNVEGFERSAPDAGAAEGSRAPGRGNAEDRGAPQQVDAFGEREGDQRRALERAGEGRQRATVAQKPAGSDGGLFDNNASQPDLLTETPARAEQRRKQGARVTEPVTPPADPIAEANASMPDGYRFAKGSGGELILQGPDRQMVGNGPLAAPGLSGIKLANAIAKGAAMARERAAKAQPVDAPAATRKKEASNAGAEDSRGAPAKASAPAAVSLDDATFERIWKSPAFKATMKQLGELPHRESPVAVETARGWADGLRKDIDALLDYENTDGHSSTVFEAQKGGGTGWNPRVAYVEGFYAAVMPEPREVRAVPANGRLGAGQAIEQIAAKLDPEGSPSPAPAKPASDYGASNKLVTADRAAVLREKLRAKMNQINSGIDPEVLALGTELAVFHIEAGARKFADFSRRMIADIGESARPYLRSFYEAARYYPGVEAMAQEMSTAAEIEEASRGDQGAVRPGDARAGAENVQRAAEDRSDGRAPDRQGEGSRGNVPGNERGRADAPERAAEGSQPAARDRAADTGNADRVPARDDAGRGRGERAAARDAKRVTGENWRIEPGALDEARSAATKARDNVRAIEIVRELDRTGQPATREQQAALAKYVGWGGLKNAFNETNGTFAKGFEEIGPRVRELLSEEEYDTARRSIQYAHYTSEKIIRPMWEAAQRMGFTGGKVFEPGMGTGNFLGMMPAEIAARTQYQGIEFDGITARIAELLYPQSGIRQADFTRGAIPKDAFDLVIGNPPFSQTVVKSDPEYGKLGFVLHDFFFAKSLDAVRPGGLLMFVTSAGTMNKVSTEARAWMADRADLVGAVRLPGGAFRENAGTDVTTDIVVLRKRAPGDRAGSRAWVDTTELTLPTRSGTTAPVEVNNYFVANPDQILGEHGLFDTLAAGERYGVRMREGADMAADLAAALDRVTAGTQIEQRDAVDTAAEFDMDSTERKEGSFYVGKDGRLMQHRNGLGAPVESRGKGVKGGIPAADQERIKALVPIRDALRTVLSHDMAGRTAQATEARAALNGAYDRFVQQFGPINKAEIRYQRPSIIEQETARAAAREEVRLMGGFFNEGSFTPEDPNAKTAEIAAARRAAREAAAAMGREFDEGDFDPADMPDKVIVKRPNVDAFMDDQEGYRLRSIEHYNDDTGEAKKGAIFFQNVVSQERAPQINSTGDALLYVLNRTGRPDIAEIAARAGVSRDQALQELDGKIFKVPGQGETYQTREQYLSGNVRQKLAMAQAAAARDPDFRANVAALEAVQPRPLGPSDIAASLGMPWIPEGVVKQFAETLGLNNVAVRYRPKLAQWSAHGNAYGAAATSEWGTGRRDAIALLGDILNRQTPVIYDTFRTESGEQRVRNDVETQAAQDKMRAIAARFRDWVWEDAKRATDLVGLYNENYNNLVAPTYDGSYLTTPGIAEGWSWRPHQQRVVSRIIQSGNTYMAHAVGAGKTSAMIGAGMEMRRLGLVRKPMYVVPNHMLGQFTKEFYEQYPTAKIMVADERQFHTDRRKQFVANVGTSDLDAVIITHSAFGFIPISEGFNEKLLRQQISEFRDVLNELKAERSGDPAQRITQRNIEQQIESLEQRIRGRKKRSDQVFNFEETGVDFLFVDEAHLFRKLDFATKMSNVRGVDPSGSGMSYDLFAKTRYLEEQNPGRSHVLASGTPVTNTMAELFSVQRYLQPQELAARQLGQFDAWAGAFGETVTQLEQDPAGGYKPVTRFAKFVNVPELSAMVRQVMDVVTSRELEQYVVRPKLLGGSRQMRVSEPTPALNAYQESLAARMRAIEQRSGKPKKGDDILLSVIGDGRKAAIDMRLVNPSIRETGKSKLEDLIENVSRIAKETENHPFYRAEATGYAAEPFMRGRATQMIFSDLGINGDFQVHRYMRQQLIARGLKDSEVAIISDYKTSVARQRLFNDMNEGKVRVLIGSVPKMGTGVNAQKRLFAIHNLDPQWYPANDEQRNGRGLRQGNMNRELGIYDYSTKATYDSTMWGLMETKARFIEGFFNGDPTMRSMEDLGEASQYEQAKALTTTDPRIMELTQDKQDLERALLRRAGFERDLYAVRERIASAERGIERLTAAVPHREADLAQRQDLSGDNFTATVMGKTFTNREEFGEAVLDRMNALAEGGLTVRDKPVGEISGFKLTADVSRYGRENVDVTLYFNRNGDVQERVKTTTPAGIASSAASIMRGFESDVEAAKSGIEGYKREIAEYTPQTTKTFNGAAEIAELEKRVADMEDTLTKEAAARAASRSAAPTAPEGAKLSTIDDEAAADAYADEYLDSDFEALRAKLAAQARKMGVSGDRLVISTVNRLLNDERVAGMYFDGVITVATDARTSPERTFDHEFIHALKDMGLFRGAEWTTLARDAAADNRLMQRIAERYPALGRDAQIEEAVAEMFADWKGERTGFRGAALGRIRDFIDAIRRLFRGVDTSGDIMRRIAAGRVGAREGVAAGGDAQMSILGTGAVNPNPQTVSEATERAQTFMGRLAEGYENWRIAMQDRMLPVQRAEAAVERVIGRPLEDSERPYLAEELMSGRVGAKLGRMTEEHIEPLQAAMLAEKISVDELESFLYAKHAPERNAYIASVNPQFAQGEGSGMTDIEAAAILARIDREGRTREFERVADRVYALLQFARDERADAGLLSAEQLDSWNSAYQYYVPLRGFAELDNGESRPSTGGQGITVRGAESKKAFGRRSKADDILAHSIMQAEEAIVRGEKNRVARAFYDMAKASPDKDFWQTNKVSMERRMNPLTGLVEDYVVTNLLARDADMTVSLKIDGKERRVTMNRDNPEARKVAEAMRRLDEQGATNQFVALLSKYNRFQSTVNTSLNPEFVITNAFRDLQTAGVNLAGLDLPGLQRRTLRDWRKAMVAATKGAFGKGTGEWERWWREFTDEGGRVSYNQMQDVAAITRDFERRFDPARRPNPAGLNTSPKQAAMIAWGDIKAAYGFIDKLNTGVENAIRLSAYKNARELGVSAPQAASIAKNLTVNFNRRGSWGVQMNALYLFYNASIQGTARMLMAMRSRRVQQIVGGIVAMGVLQELLNMMIGPDDDDGEPVYDKIPEFEKSRNMILMASGPWGAYLKLPMPWGYNAFHSLGRNIVRAARGERAATVAADTASVFFDAFNPIGNGSLLNLIAPTFADPAVDLIQNRDFADRPIMPDQPQYGQPVPDNQRYWNSVNPVWKGVTDTLNTATGGDKVVPGAVDVSPETLEYLFALGTGAAGAFVDRTAGAAVKLADGDPESVLGVNDVPLARKLVGAKPEWHDKAAFYARLGEIEGKVDNAREYAKSGDREATKAYIASERPSIGLAQIATAARAGMREVRQARGALEVAKDRGKIDAATYADRKKRVADAEKRVITLFNTAYLKAIDQPLKP